MSLTFEVPENAVAYVRRSFTSTPLGSFSDKGRSSRQLVEIILLPATGTEIRSMTAVVPYTNLLPPSTFAGVCHTWETMEMTLVARYNRTLSA